MSKVNLKKSSKLMLSAGVISIPMLALGGGPLTIPGSSLNCSYTSFELSPSGNLILNLSDISCLGTGGDTGTTGGDTGTTGGDTGTTGGDTGTTGGDTGTTGGDTGTTGGDTGEHYSDPNARIKYNQKLAYSSKQDFYKTTIPNEPAVTVYIVNSASGIGAQPQCVNGQSALHCGTLYGSIEGAKQNEIYATRFLTKPGSTPVASFTAVENEFTFSRAVTAKWEYSLSDKPGLMLPSDHACSFDNYGSKRRLYTNLDPSKYYDCSYPSDTMLYLNARIAESDYNRCGTENCTDYVRSSGFAGSIYD